MVSGDFCEHDWPGSGCPECKILRETTAPGKARIGNPPFFFTRAGKAEIKRRLAAGERAVDLAAYYGVHRSAISYIKRKYDPNKTKGP